MQLATRVIWLSSFAYMFTLPAGCGAAGTKRASTAASADESEIEEGADAKKALTETKKPCGTTTGTVTTNITATPGPVQLLETAPPPLPAPAPAPAATPTATAASDKNCTPATTPPPATANGAGTGTTPPLVPPPAGNGAGTPTTPTPPAGLLFTGKTLEQCNAEGKAWVPGSGGAATCGDALVSWCCSLPEASNQFPSLAAQLGATIGNNEKNGLKLYNCSYANSKFTMHFVKSDTTGMRFSTSYWDKVTPTPKAAPTSCPLPKAASLGL
ncbi:MAG: hypothetical protein FJ146_06995 [Deltaproteobacteria bacterium]|nr:hypothetical protein [Deltaproteobacteria bacterium]